ncbi:hypothetical protein KFL_008530010 [Klebsormidium nitens]|uniref:Uncharacterized protein n=1 Tax=Klebsormidium nitens TaxID=105231 RepID=A0A1Y1ILP1_KLENI|nr:hypothetical protein KFL_008530010 [Klebsormidium nitens]|eukprot:GAQ91780.1 hypothetical protein KFL_008530010 [Klebsormidium nitens]
MHVHLDRTVRSLAIEESEMSSNVRNLEFIKRSWRALLGALTRPGDTKTIFDHGESGMGARKASVGESARARRRRVTSAGLPDWRRSWWPSLSCIVAEGHEGRLGQGPAAGGRPAARRNSLQRSTTCWSEKRAAVGAGLAQSLCAVFRFNPEILQRSEEDPQEAAATAEYRTGQRSGRSVTNAPPGWETVCARPPPGEEVGSVWEKARASHHRSGQTTGQRGETARAPRRATARGQSTGQRLGDGRRAAPRRRPKCPENRAAGRQPALPAGTESRAGVGRRPAPRRATAWDRRPGSGRKTGLRVAQRHCPGLEEPGRGQETACAKRCTTTRDRELGNGRETACVMRCAIAQGDRDREPGSARRRGCAQRRAAPLPGTENREVVKRRPARSVALPNGTLMREPGSGRETACAIPLGTGNRTAVGSWTARAKRRATT